MTVLSKLFFYTIRCHSCLHFSNKPLVLLFFTTFTTLIVISVRDSVGEGLSQGTQDHIERPFLVGFTPNLLLITERIRKMTNIWSINMLFIIALVLVFHSSVCLEVSVHSSDKKNSITNVNSKSNSNTNRSGSNGGIYFSDIPLSDAEGSADGPDDDLDDNASGKGEDDEDTKDIIDKEGSGSQPTNTGSGPDSDDEDDDVLELGSGDDSLFISSTERPTIRPDVTKMPVTPPQESKEPDIETPKLKEPIPDPIDENRVPIDSRPSVETSTRFTIQSSTHWSRDRDRDDDNNSLGNEVSIMGHKQVTPASFFARPGILAAVIGGAVVGLLCAILLVMFIVYRMRKKDEGSYALDEHKRSTSANPYARGASKELYA